MKVGELRAAIEGKADDMDVQIAETTNYVIGFTEPKEPPAQPEAIAMPVPPEEPPAAAPAPEPVAA